MVPASASLTVGARLALVVAFVAAVLGGLSPSAAQANGATRPSAPLGVTANPVSATSATINWQRPVSDGGAAITQFSVTVRVSGSGAFAGSCTAGGAGSSCVVSGLAARTAYTADVRALNSAGWGAVGLLPGTFTTTAPTRPSAPLGVTANPVSATSATINWQRPVSDGGAAITQFSVTVRVSGSGAFAGSCTAGGAGSSCVVSGLAARTAYTADVRALNSAGWGAVGLLPGTFTTAAATTPSAPTSPAAVPGAGQIAYSWLVPASNGGSPVTEYSVTVRTTGGIFAGSCTVPASQLGCTVAGLTPGTTYTASVRARNAVGWGSPAAFPALSVPAAS